MLGNIAHAVILKKKIVFFAQFFQKKKLHMAVRQFPFLNREFFLYFWGENQNRG
jgi:hypothetical protein